MSFFFFCSLHVVGVLRCRTPLSCFFWCMFCFGSPSLWWLRKVVPLFWCSLRWRSELEQDPYSVGVIDYKDNTQVVDAINHGDLPWKCWRSEHRKIF
uniref:Uncharacterized protein n=1 Tax=Physcomitrium patens TaxID=3218 RepID=A0A2K1KXM3_PHYPA|nr:hypothetical protein PHYPA_005527 [Physcomitrium patens]